MKTAGRSLCFIVLWISFRWDMYMGNLELVEEIDGHTDIVYGSFDPKFFKR